MSGSKNGVENKGFLCYDKDGGIPGDSTRLGSYPRDEDASASPATSIPIKPLDVPAMVSRSDSMLKSMGFLRIMLL